MHKRELADWLGPGTSGHVELRVSAEPRLLPLLRSVARMVASGEGLDPDAVTDVTVAVDEACASLIQHSVPGAVLTCRYVVAGGCLCVAVSATTSHGSVPDSHTFGWRVLGGVTDAVSAWRLEPDTLRAIDRVVHIDFAKQFAHGRPG